MGHNGYLLWMGDPRQWENPWVQALDDGFWRKGVPRSLEALTTGDFAGNTSIILNGKTDTHPNACVFDRKTGLTWSKTPSGSVGPSSNGLLYWDDHIIRGSHDGAGDDFVAFYKLSQAVSGATAQIRYADNDNNRIGAINDKGTWDLVNTITDDSPGTGGPATPSAIVGPPAKEDIFEFVRLANLAGLAGFSDWRVPNINELATIMVYDSIAGNARPDTNFFAWPGTTEYIWSSTHFNPASLGAVAVTFDDGAFHILSKGWGTGYVYLVRGPDLSEDRSCLVTETGQYLYQDSLFRCDGLLRKGIEKSWAYNFVGPLFTMGYLNGDTETATWQTTITDNNTTVEWMQDTNDSSVPFYDDDGTRKDALGYCHWANEKAFGGQRDWRIPTVFDYLSLILGTDGKLWSSYFWNNTRELWTSTPVPDDPDKCYAHKPGEYFEKKDRSSDTAYVRLCRGGVNYADF